MGRGHKLFCQLSGDGERFENIFGGTWGLWGSKNSGDSSDSNENVPEAPKPPDNI